MSEPVERARLPLPISVLAVGLSMFQVWAVVFSSIDPLLARAIFLAWMLALAFLCHSARGGRAERPAPTAILLALVSALSGVYFAFNFEAIEARWPMVDALTGSQVLFGLATLLLLAEATRRTIGMPIVLIALIFAGYVLLGHHLGGPFSHRYLSIREFIDQMVYTGNGIYGAPLAVAASYVYLFVLFGAMLYRSGAGEFFIALASAAARGGRGGAAKVAVVASALYGMISGSPTSDAVTTGTFTIPLMRRMGYGAVQAGAIVAVSATGGSIMPPVMGSAAFIMSEFTGIPYIKIAVAAAIPALLYYLGVIAQVHFQALKLDLVDASGERSPELRRLLVGNLWFLVPIAALVWLLFRGYTPTRSAAVAALLTVAVSWLGRGQARPMGLRQLVLVLEEAALASIVIATATAAAGVVVGAIAVTGLGGKLTSLLLGLTGGSLLPILVLTMLICIALGMGMPVPSAYVLTAVLAGPALVGAGLSLLAAHLFIVYFSVMSAITPPVAVAAYAAAGIAGADPNRIGFLAVRLGIVAFIVPFMFVYQPELLLGGSWLSVVLALATAVIGVVALAGGLEGWLLLKATWIERLLLGAGGLLMIKPGLYTDVAGVALLLFVTWRQSRRKRRARAVARAEASA